MGGNAIIYVYLIYVVTVVNTADKSQCTSHDGAVECLKVVRYERTVSFLFAQHVNLPLVTRIISNHECKAIVPS